jgi:RNA polymerase-interacting CarD/CdnL/TRCF family regulator
MTDGALFTAGQWVVHIHHGVGRVRQKSVKRIGDREGIYIRVDLDNSILWVPEDNINLDAFRPLASEEELNEAFEVLRRPAREMAANFTKRKSRIDQVQSRHSFVSTARLVRDLWSRQQVRALSNTEESALRELSRRLLDEWAVCMSIEVDEAQQMLYGLLHEGHSETASVE